MSPAISEVIKRFFCMAFYGLIESEREKLLVALMAN